MDILIREAKEQDATAIFLLNKNGLGYDFNLHKTQERLGYILAKPSNKIFVALVDAEIMGYVHAADYDCTYSASLKNILAIVVAENARGLGVGRSLLTAVESWAKETGCAGVRLVSGFNRQGAHQFYLSCGYADRKDQKNFIKRF